MRSKVFINKKEERKMKDVKKIFTTNIHTTYVYLIFEISFEKMDEY